MSMVLFPGLGADGRMYDPQRAGIPDLVTPSWDAYLAGGSLADFARRIVEETPAVLTAEAIGGSSFGGFVAWEMAAITQPSDLILIGSASSTKQLRSSLHALLPISRWIPRPLLSVVPHTGLSAAPIFGANSLQTARAFADMGRGLKPEFLAWALRAIAGWLPSPLPPRTKVHRLHGSRDLLIRPPSDGATLLPNAGHLPTLTHSTEVLAFLVAVQSDVTRRRAEQGSDSRAVDQTPR